MFPQLNNVENRTFIVQFFGSMIIYEGTVFNNGEVYYCFMIAIFDSITQLNS